MILNPNLKVPVTNPMTRVFDPGYLHRVYKKETPSNLVVVDTRPVSANFGQDCIGYFEENGKLVGIKPKHKTSADIGPGSYNPQIFDPTDKKIVIPKDTKRTTFLTSSAGLPGPSEYCYKEKDTRLGHRIWSDAHQSMETETPLSGELEHQNLVSSKKGKSAVFLSKTKRAIFQKKKFKVPDPTAHQYFEKPKEDPCEYDPMSRSQTERFPSPRCESPAPTRYTIPSSFGKGRGHEIKQDSDFYKKPPEITPAPGDYYQPTKLVKAKQSPVFRTTLPREPPIRSITPGPGAYNIEKTTRRKGKPTFSRADGRPSDSWTSTSLSDAPPPGAYNPRDNEWGTRGTTISTLTHSPFKPAEYHPLENRTLHSSLIKKSFNANYFNITCK